MKTIKQLVFLTLCLTLFVASCKKDDKTTMTKEELLSAKPWKLASSKTNGIADVIPDCDKDDLITLTTNGIYTYNPGSNKCDPDETPETGIWALSADEKSLILDGESLDIIELTESKLVISMSNGIYSYEATYTSL